MLITSLRDPKSPSFPRQVPNGSTNGLPPVPLNGPPSGVMPAAIPSSRMRPQRPPTTYSPRSTGRARACTTMGAYVSYTTTRVCFVISLTPACNSTIPGCRWITIIIHIRQRSGWRDTCRNSIHRRGRQGPLYLISRCRREDRNPRSTCQAHRR